MAKKLSKETRVKISNARHWTLLSKYGDVLMNSTNLDKCKKARIKVYYHDAVRRQQEKYGCLLTRDEKKQIFSSISKYNG